MLVDDCHRTVIGTGSEVEANERISETMDPDPNHNRVACCTDSDLCAQEAVKSCVVEWFAGLV